MSFYQIIVSNCRILWWSTAFFHTNIKMERQELDYVLSVGICSSNLYFFSGYSSTIFEVLVPPVSVPFVTLDESQFLSGGILIFYTALFQQSWKESFCQSSHWMRTSLTSYCDAFPNQQIKNWSDICIILDFLQDSKIVSNKASLIFN